MRTPAALVQAGIDGMARIPHAPVALLARLSIAVTFLQSGQTKVQGLVIDLVGGHVSLGVPRLSDSVVDLFRDEYALPLIPPELAAPLAAGAEHLFPLMLLVGLGTRYAALALLVMTVVIEVFVYPLAYPTHALWAVALLYLMANGPGPLALDGWVARAMARRRASGGGTPIDSA